MDTAWLLAAAGWEWPTLFTCSRHGRREVPKVGGHQALVDTVAFPVNTCQAGSCWPSGGRVHSVRTARRPEAVCPPLCQPHQRLGRLASPGISFVAALVGPEPPDGFDWQQSTSRSRAPPAWSFSRIPSLISRRVLCRRSPVTFPTDHGSFPSPRVSDTRGLSEAHPCARPPQEGGLGPEGGAPPVQAPVASGSPGNRGSGCQRDLGHAVCAPSAQLWPRQGHGPCFLWLQKLTFPPRSASTWVITASRARPRSRHTLPAWTAARPPS